MPFLNRLLNSLNMRDFTVLIVFIFLLFTIFSRLFDPFSIGNGYTFVWLAVMYTIGAYLKKYGTEICENKKFPLGKGRLFLIYLVCVIISFASKIIIPILTKAILGRELLSNILVSYTSPTVVISTMVLIMLFSKIEMPKVLSKIFVFLSPLSFGVYLIHEHMLIRSYFVTDKFIFLAEINPLLAVLAVVGIAVAIFLGCSIVEFIRGEIFKWTRLTALTNKIGKALDNKLNFK